MKKNGEEIALKISRSWVSILFKFKAGVKIGVRLLTRTDKTFAVLVPYAA